MDVLAVTLGLGDTVDQGRQDQANVVALLYTLVGCSFTMEQLVWSSIVQVETPELCDKVNRDALIPGGIPPYFIEALHRVNVMKWVRLAVNDLTAALHRYSGPGLSRRYLRIVREEEDKLLHRLMDMTEEFFNVYDRVALIALPPRTRDQHVTECKTVRKWLGRIAPVDPDMVTAVDVEAELAASQAMNDASVALGRAMSMSSSSGTGGKEATAGASSIGVGAAAAAMALASHNAFHVMAARAEQRAFKAALALITTGDVWVEDACELYVQMLGKAKELGMLEALAASQDVPPMGGNDSMQHMFVHPAIPWIRAGCAKALEALRTVGVNMDVLVPGGLSLVTIAVGLNSPMIPLFLEMGVSLSRTGPSGITPLHVAHTGKVVQMLARSGARGDALTLHGLSPVETAGCTEKMVSKFLCAFCVDVLDVPGRAMSTCALMTLSGNMKLLLFMLRHKFRYHDACPSFEDFFALRRALRQDPTRWPLFQPDVLSERCMAHVHSLWLLVTHQNKAVYHGTVEDQAETICMKWNEDFLVGRRVV
jgi:hypothetical protein